MSDCRVSCDESASRTRMPMTVSLLTAMMVPACVHRRPGSANGDA